MRYNSLWSINSNLLNYALFYHLRDNRYRSSSVYIAACLLPSLQCFYNAVHFRRVFFPMLFTFHAHPQIFFLSISLRRAQALQNLSSYIARSYQIAFNVDLLARIKSQFDKCPNFIQRVIWKPGIVMNISNTL